MLLRAGVPKHAIITQLAGAGSAMSACAYAYACRGSGNRSMAINSQACCKKRCGPAVPALLGDVALSS